MGHHGRPTRAHLKIPPSTRGVQRAVRGAFCHSAPSSSIHSAHVQPGLVGARESSLPVAVPSSSWRAFDPPAHATLHSGAMAVNPELVVLQRRVDELRCRPWEGGPPHVVLSDEHHVDSGPRKWSIMEDHGASCRDIQNSGPRATPVCRGPTAWPTCAKPSWWPWWRPSGRTPQVGLQHARC